jgi:hypothetical protein
VRSAAAWRHVRSAHNPPGVHPRHTCDAGTTLTCSCCRAAAAAAAGAVCVRVRACVCVCVMHCRPEPCAAGRVSGAAAVLRAAG